MTATPEQGSVLTAGPCGGCGEINPAKACIGCMHFYETTLRSVPVAAEGESAAPALPREYKEGPFDRIHELCTDRLIDPEEALAQINQIALQQFPAHPVEADGQASGLREGDRIGLESVRLQVQRWISFDRDARTKAGLETSDDTHIVSPPVWPSHGQLTAWVALFERLETAITNTEGMEALQGRNEPSPHPETEARIAELENGLR